MFGFAINVVWITLQGVLKVTVRRLYLEHRVVFFTAGHQQSYNEEMQQFLELSSIVFNVYWVINGFVFPWNVSIILIKQPYNTGITIIWHLDLYISSHAISTFWQFRYMKNNTTTTISHPSLPLNSRVPNSSLSVPPPQKCVLITR